ncbi:hypothetical protein [Roseibium sediminicola]|uniref:Uncharacterized protein n=1 Tax=Roseibium sediminicola TaxID=2933272 RepID=A0ABT0GRA3_9HYPH|nr:hypothetical protein [Roseibium sp. CAU 1639]MCK7611962.1 hypothetical protein [Roseibium sp. CAU 1639]
MPLPSWPASVPESPVRGSYRVPQPFNQNDITEFEAGNSRDRPRGTVQYRIVEQSIRMTQSEFETFDNFVRNDLAKGSLRFTMNVWNGYAMASATVKLSGPDKFTVAPKGRVLLVSMRLEVEL